MSVRLGVNGFGRIGRLTFRSSFSAENAAKSQVMRRCGDSSVHQTQALSSCFTGSLCRDKVSRVCTVGGGNVKASLCCTQGLKEEKQKHTLPVFHSKERIIRILLENSQ